MKTNEIKRKNTDTDPHNYSHLIFHRWDHAMCWRKHRLFNKCCWQNWIVICKRLKLDHSLSPCTSINSK
jgi:hypothetical protein